MSGKKFLPLFLVVILITAAFLAVWIKQGYDNRPKIKIEEENK